MFRKLTSALGRSVEPSGKSGREFVIRAARAQSSIRVGRISSVGVSTRPSIVSTAPIAAF
jgi:hypothetical protein